MLDRVEESTTEPAGVEPPYLWMIRYSRRGEHLKLRFHGSRDLAEELRPRLDEHVARAFEQLGPPVADAERSPNAAAPAIDAEDEAEGLHPDRSLQWTRYRRSEITLGGDPFPYDDLYTAAFTACLGQACDMVLRLLGEGEVPMGRRQSGLLRLVSAGLDSLGWTGSRRTAYLAYHRDWLVRFPLLGSPEAEEKAPRILGRMEQRLEGLGKAFEAVRRIAEEPGEPGSWGVALTGLLQRVEELTEDPGHHVDPFAPDPAFPAFFKVFHGVANQLGLSMLDEAFAHQMLLRIHEPEYDAPLFLRPRPAARGVG